MSMAAAATGMRRGRGAPEAGRRRRIAVALRSTGRRAGGDHGAPSPPCRRPPAAPGPNCAIVPNRSAATGDSAFRIAWSTLSGTLGRTGPHARRRLRQPPDQHRLRRRAR